MSGISIEEKQAREILEGLWKDLEDKRETVFALERSYSSVPVDVRPLRHQVLTILLGIAKAEIELRQCNRDEAHYCKIHEMTVEELRNSEEQTNES